jgi:large subunit ribosomal protein L17
MAASLIQHGAIRTTEAKAKELRRFVEKLITTARQGTLYARRRVIQALGDRRIADDEGEIQDQTIVQKLFDEVAPRYVDRPGGYTRIIRLSDRRIGDAGKQVLLQLIEEAPAKGGDEPTAASRRKKRAQKRHAAAGEAAPQAEAPEVDEPVETEDEAPEVDEQPAEAEAPEADAEEAETPADEPADEPKE